MKSFKNNKRERKLSSRNLLKRERDQTDQEVQLPTKIKMKTQKVKNQISL